MVPLFAIYSATFFRHEIDWEQPLILFRFNEGGRNACVRVTRIVPHPSRAFSHACGHLRIVRKIV